MVVIVGVDQVLSSSKRGEDLRTHTSIDNSKLQEKVHVHHLHSSCSIDQSVTHVATEPADNNGAAMCA